MVSSTDFLVDHAYRNAWCSPRQDRQHIVAPTRITKRQGAIGNVKLGMKTYNLPSLGKWYHVFNIGDLPPILVGMTTIVDKWVSVMGQCNATSLLVDLYTELGLHIPAHRAYWLYTHTGQLVLAILDTKKIANLGIEQPYIRWRSNAYFDGNDGMFLNDGIEIAGLTPTTQAQYSLFQAKWRAAKLLPGYAWAFVNGKRVKDINLTTAVVGDILEYTYDASVKVVTELKIKDLKSFLSTLDTKGKYLVPRAGVSDIIDYCDDIDIYMLRYHLTAAYTGHYYHQNQPDSVRMVTHRDYSIPQTYLQHFIDNIEGWIWNDDLRLEVIVRNSGWTNRPLVNEAHRIKELFKLSETNRLKAMIGEQSLDIWHAAELENSFYPKIMRAEFGGIDRPMVEKAYGYNAIAKLICDVPYKVAVNSPWVDLPFAVTQFSTVFEYDSSGLLLGWYVHDNSIQYPVHNPETMYIESYVGRGGTKLSTIYDTDLVKLEYGVDYRFYVCDIWNGVSKNNWKDVTGDDEYYTISNRVVSWHIDQTKFHTAIRDSKDFLCHTLQLNYRDDLLTLTVNIDEVLSGRVPVTDVMRVPPGQFDVILNKFTLVPDIDYYVEWPEVCIVNKMYLKPGAMQDVTIRGRGFCNPDMTLEPVGDSGFVAYEQLSHNARFNVRDDKVCRISIAGQLYTREEVAFSEDGAVLATGVKNGTPYLITHPVIPMMGVTDTDTYTLKAVSDAIDEKVEGYLTQYRPEPVQPLPSGMPAWYSVFSPFCAKLIYDMLNGILLMDEFMGTYTLQQVKEKLVGYEWILKYDPAIRGVNDEYVKIDPHPEAEVIELNIYQYRFLDRAVEAFLDGKVPLNHHLVIVEPGYEHEQDDHPHPHRSWDEVSA